MNTEITEVEINGKTYVLKSSVQAVALPTTDVSMVRCQSAGVFYGRVTDSSKLIHGVVDMACARRVWYWSGAASLSQLAVDGTSKPKDCKFPVPVGVITLTGVIEVIPMTQKAVESLNGVAIWKQ